jgi:hypothetical protein
MHATCRQGSRLGTRNRSSSFPPHISPRRFRPPVVVLCQLSRLLCTLRHATNNALPGAQGQESHSPRQSHPSHGKHRSLASPSEQQLTIHLQSWAPANLYNLYQRTYGPPTSDTKFTKSSLTMFQQKWKAKQLVRGYHGDWIQEGKFKKDYLPDGLPPIVGAKGAGAGEAKVPLASMMFAEVEKRLDTVVFRCCFADSVYRARMMVVHGKVSLNGRKVSLFSSSSARVSLGGK